MGVSVKGRHCNTRQLAPRILSAAHPNPHATSGLFTGIGVFPSSGCPTGSELVADTAGENGVLGGLTASIAVPYDTDHNLDLINGDEYTTFGFDAGGLTEVASNAPGYETRIQRTWSIDQDDGTGNDFIENLSYEYKFVHQY